jgi:hypothetical protein
MVNRLKLFDNFKCWFISFYFDLRYIRNVTNVTIAAEIPIAYETVIESELLLLS